MLLFFRAAQCRKGDAIQETLERLCLAHEVRTGRARGRDVSGPVLIDGARVIEGDESIRKHLEELEAVKALWDKYQTDACYCDDRGGIE